MRTAERLKIVYEDLAELECFLPRDGLTHCNSYVRACCVALDCTMMLGLANSQHDWLLEGGSKWWQQCSPEQARMAAAIGWPALASWKNSGGHGHIAMVAPSPDTHHDHVYIAQAGLLVSPCLPIENGFGLGKEILFFMAKEPLP